MTEFKITKDIFGKSKEGREIARFTLSNKNNVTLRVIEYGCIITEILVPDKDGEIEDICLGFEDMEGYETHDLYIGAVCGRVANRIAGGKFTLDGKEYSTPINNGPNTNHGGLKGFDKVIWNGEVQGNKVVLTYVSPDGEEGFPGELTTTVTYELTKDNELIIDYTATTLAPTLVNLTNHSYFNLGGQGSDNIDDHMLTIYAEKYTPCIENVPTGEIAPVEGTSYDLRTPVRLSKDRLKDVNDGKGFDDNFCVGDVGKLKNIARLEHPPTGRMMEVHATQPGVQCYTAYYVDDVKGKGGSLYKRLSGICFETQSYPDSIHHDNFPSIVLRPGETYRNTTIFKFSISS